MKLRRKIAYAFIPLIGIYVVVEVLTTALYWRGDFEPVSIWILEETNAGPTIQFDPILGYRLTRKPTRMACIATNGVVESVGQVRGNRLGFPDRDDFTPNRSDSEIRRFAVFGDSFTAAQYLGMNWPDRCEDLARATGRPIELLNFSIDGGGHTNWQRTLREFIHARDFQLDGVIFAVFGNDLRRPFVIWDDQVIQRAADGTRTIGFGTVWNHHLPATIEEARPFFHGLPRWQVHPTAMLDRMLNGEVRPRDNRASPYLLHRIGQALSSDVNPPRQYTLEDVIAYHNEADPTRVDLWGDIRECLKTRHLPALVVDVPDLVLMLQKSGPSVEAQAFAQFLGGQFVDGAEAYRQLSPAEIRACWLPYDAHWGQSGSDRFAGWMLRVLDRWPKTPHAKPAIGPQLEVK